MRIDTRARRSTSASNKCEPDGVAMYMREYTKVTEILGVTTTNHAPESYDILVYKVLPARCSSDGYKYEGKLHEG